MNNKKFGGVTIYKTPGELATIDAEATWWMLSNYPLSGGWALVYGAACSANAAIKDKPAGLEQ